MTPRPEPVSVAAPATESVAMRVARADSARLPWTEADADFMTGMIGHHAQAIVMSRLVATHGASAPVQRLAARIINAQQDEIALMQRWLRDRSQPVPDLSVPQAAMRGMDHAAHMPGMLTPVQLTDLGQARGGEFDRKFLTYMLQHHRGAMVMVDKLFQTPGAGQDEATFKIANDVQADQGTEINRMTIMLLTLPGDRP
ncbi:MAG: DUF305 domain-containing protein [Gemmatimonadales bacterium]